MAKVMRLSNPNLEVGTHVESLVRAFC